MGRRQQIATQASIHYISIDKATFVNAALFPGILMCLVLSRFAFVNKYRKHEYAFSTKFVEINVE